jgi:putative oxygen-independent coproporphyrinogen III oxidase
MTGAAHEPLALYIHWPFCLSKCPYCDFNSHVADGIDQARWRTALIAELDNAASGCAGRPLGSIFFGGGTPSLMAPETAAALITRAQEHWPAGEGLEVTLEANPTSVEAGRFAAFANAGVNRLSLGIQALDDEALRFLGREHSAGQALGALEIAIATFGRVSLDLIYARPGQSEAGWRDELARALEYGTEHLSLYQLTVEKGTPFFAAHRDGAFAVPGEDLAVALFEATDEILRAAGRPAYEISNHARPGAECRHNLAIWQYGEYLGIGPGAHGRLAGRAQRRAHAPSDWLARVEETGSALIEDRALGADERAIEALVMGLRLAGGIDAARFAQRTGVALDDAIDAAAAERLANAGLIERDGAGLRASPRGRRLLNSVLAALSV